MVLAELLDEDGNVAEEAQDAGDTIADAVR